MAQPVFDEHPLGAYLREAGENPTMPGVSPALQNEIDPPCDAAWMGLGTEDNEDEDAPHIYSGPSAIDQPRLLVDILQLLETLSTLFAAHNTAPSRTFVEKFKYRVISSSLLASSLQAPHASRNSSLSLPGRLGGHSRSSSRDMEGDSFPTFQFNGDPAYHLNATAPDTTATGPASTSIHGQQQGGIPLATMVAGAAVLFGRGFPLLGGLAVTAYYVCHSMGKGEGELDMSTTLAVLDELIAASDAWDAAVQEALAIIESDEAAHPRLPIANTATHPLRIALLTHLQTTQSQCDNVRQLFAALTCPSELAQLSEMYAPSSPLAFKPVFNLESGRRPISFPSASRMTPRSQTSSLSGTPDKRNTWAGTPAGYSYASLADAGSPTSGIRSRKEGAQHRQQQSERSFRPPPSPSTSHLEDVQEDDVDVQFVNVDGSFGSAALDFRSQRSARLPPPDFLTATPLKRTSTLPLLSPSPIRSPFTSPSSKFTSMNSAARHPHSLVSLHHTLQGALASKRYTASHLLALRFKEDGADAEGYWEDVRSLISLLVTAFSGGLDRLGEVVESVERVREEERRVTPVQRTVSGEQDGSKQKRRSTHMQTSSFAPVASPFARFAVHVGAIENCLDDAKELLEGVVDVLKEGESGATSTIGGSGGSSTVDGDIAVHPALEAYERLRKELGVALRECERGREKLLELVKPPRHSDFDSDSENDVEEEGSRMGDLPALGHDASDDSDKPPQSPFDEVHELVDDSPPHSSFKTREEMMDFLGGVLEKVPVGAEEVFEADLEENVRVVRERSRLSREERIRLMKERRERKVDVSALSSIDSDKWGPGGDVVQELKDVIWKVGEKRRKSGQQPSASTGDADS